MAPILEYNQKSAPDAFTELKLITERILEGQTRMEKDIAEIKTNLFDPDAGLYARVARNTEFRISASKWMWIISTGVLVALMNGLIGFLFK